MKNFDRQKHWEHIYRTKEYKDMSWYQSAPVMALRFFKKFNIHPTAKIIDIGGGDSFLVDSLLDWGYTDITVLDISSTALQRARQRLGEHAAKVKWIVDDVVHFNPHEQYDVWHDRATLHFITEEVEIMRYVSILQAALRPGGLLIIGVFSEQGPRSCSGIAIKQYSEKSLTHLLEAFFEKKECLTVDHITPSGAVQNFVFCAFMRKNDPLKH
ncbi:MAG: hypothetical protein KatS3mg031_0619 [Chitinophagales bacterium]|nr:MAG: hypothetical protein KatS3mg031_0619 [Chitinophagales bacterium]